MCGQIEKIKGVAGYLSRAQSYPLQMKAIQPLTPRRPPWSFSLEGRVCGPRPSLHNPFRSGGLALDQSDLTAEPDVVDENLT